MDLNYFIKHAPSIIENQVKTALIRVAKENNISDATQMNVLVHYNKIAEQEQISFIPHYKGKEVARIPMTKIIDGSIGDALRVLMLKIWNDEKDKNNIAIEYVNFIMKLQPNGIVLVWSYHCGVYGTQMRVKDFLSL